jgi:mannan endo-1,4-beta-mannosidase
MMMRARVLTRNLVIAALLVACCPFIACCAHGFHARSDAGSRAIGGPDFVTARDGRLYLESRRYRFVGVNVYSLASFPPDSCKYYCGIAHTDQGVRDIMREVAEMGGNVIRIDAYQSFTEGGQDFSRLDFVIAEAKKRGIRLILTLENQWHDCTQGGYKFADWYRSGYRRPYGAYRLSFADYVRLVVGRYRDEPTVLMWQVMNEAESQNRIGAADPYALLTFAEEMAALVKSIDVRHLLSFGTTGVERPGSGGIYYGMLANIAGIDVVEAHDYGDDRQAMPDDIRRAQEVARLAGKPFFVGEVGISSPPLGREERAKLVMDKLEAGWDADFDGILIWSYRAGDGTNRDFDANDPLAAGIRRFTATHLAP